ncbi:MAG: tripartite tricarboxylate transporter permease, partial [Hyphomicrobiaceae bacterium]|nr:tripartite tricarboxylate transporter permease [Hyphomicrobiaceae bacterium]
VIFGVPISISVVMVLCGLLTGIVVGAIPGLSGPFAMAVSLPILISVFGVNADALLPVVGFLIGIMKGATVGGAVPAILFNTPGTPDALLTTLDGFPMTQKGQSGKALRVAWFSSATGDTFSDIVLFTTAPFLAVVVEAYLGFTEKAALVLLSLAFIAVVVGRSVLKGLLAALFGLFVALIAHGEDTYPRLSLGIPALREGIPLISAVVGVLILGEVFKAIEDLRREQRSATKISSFEMLGDNKLRWADIRRIAPNIGVSALIGTIIGALPGIGSTLAATMGYEAAKQMSKTPEAFGTGIPEGVAATEAANSAVSGANLIPVLSLGIPGNVAAVFIILAMESISGFNPGPGVFRFNPAEINRELVMAFGLFTLMMLGNLLNWTIGGVFMRATGVLIRIPKQILLPVVLLLTLTSVYVEKGHMSSVVIAVIFGFVGYLMRRLEVSVLPFVISFILAANLETSMRQAFAASGSDPWFMFKSPIAVAFLMMIAAVIYWFGIRPRRGRHLTAAIQNAKGD